MSRVLITGGTGGLGREAAPRLAGAGATGRGMSRRAAPAEGAPTEWAQAQIETGEGLAEAVAGVDVIVHCASSPFRRTRVVDVEGTRRLLEAAKAAGVPHFVYISIVGIDRIPLGYYKHKLAAERLIEESGVPYSIQRAPQFHTLVDQIMRNLLRFPVGLYPAGFKFQPIDPGDGCEHGHARPLHGNWRPGQEELVLAGEQCSVQRVGHALIVRFPVSSQPEQRLESSLHAQCGPHFHDQVSLVVRIVPQRMWNAWGKNCRLAGAETFFLPAQPVADAS